MPGGWKRVIRAVCPSPVVELARGLLWRLALRRSLMRGEVPSFADFVGYETLVRFLTDQEAYRLPGDFVEIGAFLGGGTAKLAALAASIGKSVWVVDIFDPNFDHTATVAGVKMSDMYAHFLRHASQEEIFHRVTKPHAKHLRVIRGDSREVAFPPGTDFSFGFIDGNHDPAWVENDFRLVWPRIVPGGWIGFHDYGGDLPLVTSTINELMGEYSEQIAQTVKIQEKTIILACKSGGARSFSY